MRCQQFLMKIGEAASWLKDEEESIEGSIEDLMHMLHEELQREQAAFSELEKLLNLNDTPEA